MTFSFNVMLTRLLLPITPMTAPRPRPPFKKPPIWMKTTPSTLLLLWRRLRLRLWLLPSTTASPAHATTPQLLLMAIAMMVQLMYQQEFIQYVCDVL